MRITHVTHRAWPVIGGSERYVQEIARRQVLDGHHVCVVATDAADLEALWSQGGRRVGAGIPNEHQGVRIRRVPARHLPFGSLAFPVMRRFAWLAGRFSKRLALPLARFSPWLPGLRQVLSEESADLLFAWHITLEGLTAAAAHEASRRGVPWVAVPLLHLGRRRFYTMPHQLHLLRGARAILAQTPSERAFLLECGFEAGRVHVVSPGVDLSASIQADGRRFCARYGLDRPIVLSLGVLCYDKGTLHLLAAARELWRRGRKLTLVLLGRQQGDVQRALAQLPETDRVSCLYLGEVPEEEKWDAMAAAHVMAMPSRTESFGIVFLEAWALGKPVVAARIGAVTDVIQDGVDGLLVPFGSVEDLAGALERLLDDPAEAADMGRRGQEKVRGSYTWDQQYARLRVILDESAGKA